MPLAFEGAHNTLARERASSGDGLQRTQSFWQEQCEAHENIYGCGLDLVGCSIRIRTIRSRVGGRSSFDLWQLWMFQREQRGLYPRQGRENVDDVSKRTARSVVDGAIGGRW